ncbi:MerR family transcriptional regulator [Kutzneria sp. CA-103260]|uniref:MerR family transcriptional regulator n=1 Tax=Kutzneria sp. CA-103260 TaxID=2802641 RepID=UPI001BA5A4DB|nr:MerR family transcriptional regulator [Kutzneria sp. CA-103260]
MDDTELYAIGDVARRTGLSVSAVRFYADADIIAPTCHSDSGYRLYDVHAIARLELVRTLRELDASLDDIRRLLAEETTLHELAATHLELVEGQLRRLHARRAVLRAVVRKQSPNGQVNLMHKLVSMSDDDRNRLVEEFWHEVTADVDGHSAAVRKLRERKPELPDEPTSEQLEAWIELADLLRSSDFRAEMRQILRNASAVTAQRQAVGPDWHQRADALTTLFQEAQEAQRTGMSVDSAQARNLAERFVAWGFDSAGEAGVSAHLRRAVAATDMPDPAARHEGQAGPGFRVGLLLGRYLSLVARVNGTTPSEQEHTRADSRAAWAWLAAAIEARTA